MNTLKVVSDLICPWCYIGKRRMEAALRELPLDCPVSVSWHPFQLNPQMPADGMPRKTYRIQKFGSWERSQAMDYQLAEVGRTVGLELHGDMQTHVPNTFDSHRVIWLAGREGVQDAVVEALFRAYFCEGINLSVRAQLIEVTASAGLDSSEVERLLSSEAGAKEVQAEEKEIKALGISSVPLFIINERVAVSGAQPPETLLQAFRQAEKPRTGRTPERISRPR